MIPICKKHVSAINGSVSRLRNKAYYLSLMSMNLNAIVVLRNMDMFKPSCSTANCVVTLNHPKSKLDA